METFLYIFSKTIYLILGVVSFAMLVRMIMPFFTDVEESRFYLGACLISEPFVAPIRAIMVKFNIGQDSPIDWAFFTTAFIIGSVRLFLPII